MIACPFTEEKEISDLFFATNSLLTLHWLVGKFFHSLFGTVEAAEFDHLYCYHLVNVIKLTQIHQV